MHLICDFHFRHFCGWGKQNIPKQRPEDAGQGGNHQTASFDEK